MKLGYAISYCFMGLVAFVAVAAQTALASGMIVSA
jgi:hypothetical protein